MRTAEDDQRVARDVRLRIPREPGQRLNTYKTAWMSNRLAIQLRKIEEGSRPYNDTKAIPQRGAERLELGWGPPGQYRSHGGEYHR